MNLPPKGKGPLRRKSVVVSSEDSENDFEETPERKKIKKDVSSYTDCCYRRDRQLKSEVQSVLKITKNLKYPPGLYLIINNTFSCKICLGIINPPVIFARCCKNNAGLCCDNLYGGENGAMKRCPLCRTELDHCYLFSISSVWFTINIIFFKEALLFFSPFSCLKKYFVVMFILYITS